MIQYKTGNLLEAHVEALVNTVNCVGVMGKGIALQFKQAYPENFKQYKKACNADEVVIGKMFITSPDHLISPKYIVNFPTKRHWRSKSRLPDIESGLRALVTDIKRLNINSIAIPPLGCGNGGLNWNEVRVLIEQALTPLKDVTIWLYEPAGAPQPDKMPIANKNLKMTRARALLLCLIDMYRTQEYRLSRIEIQKLAYFLQESGEPMKLQYVKHNYGPYASNLKYILQKMEGQYTRGYGDGSQRAEIYPLESALSQAKVFLEADQEAEMRLNRMQDLIAGFETPYSLELLATVHWICHHEADSTNIDEIIQRVQNWNERKKERYQTSHIKIAYNHLHKQGWI